MEDHTGEPTHAGARRISCDECVMQHSEACADCVVTFLCGREPHEAVVIDVDEERALRLLAGAGLAPGLRHRPRSQRAVPVESPRRRDATMVGWAGRS